jgi:sulfate transport system ATP-binding protein
MTRVGFEVRLVVGTDDGREVSVVTTRAHARSLRLEEGQRIWVTPSSGASTVPAMSSVLVS